MEFSRKAFKAYDIRGRVPDELNEAMTYRIGRVFAEIIGAKKVAVGRDVRLSSEPLAKALIQGLVEAGCDVVDVGLCGTEQIYFATSHLHLDGGIMITASHNPKGYNGLKLVRKDSRPISGDTGLRELENRVVQGPGPLPSKQQGRVIQTDIMSEYVAHLLGYIDTKVLRPLKIVVNSGNGCAGPVLDALALALPFEFVKIHHEPDGTFPHGIPNPLLRENQSITAEAVRAHKADLGIAWDGDFDRCFFFDEGGNFIEGYYLVGFLGEAFLRRYPKAKIIHDPRLTWNTIELVEQAGGIPVQSKTGHAFIKERMRIEDAVYGGEMSAHHYFRDFFYCDSGMIPWLLIVESLSLCNRPLSTLVQERIACYPVSGEINREVEDAKAVLSRIEKLYLPTALRVDRTDGLSIEYETWRFNIRMSNTEPLLRLNVESRHNRILMREKTAELLRIIDGCL
ncbi:MAG: phosphomannomutase [Sporomusaceae bacterium]|nr:phosphomannomutase [Sporomusaceae bacterium]